jgi:thioredoxin-like negative regulator of GroEL
VRALDQLGLVYLSLDQPAEAEKVLREAMATAPRDPEVLLHLGRALIALDRQPEAQPYLDQFQKLRPQQARNPRREPGMIELATMSQEERTGREIERLRRDARTHPSDPELQLQLADLLLTDGRTEEAAAAYRELLTRYADSRIWHRAGTALAQAGEYKLARDFLERAADIPAARLDLAIALFFTGGPREALSAIERVPETERGGDYWLMKARILEAAGQDAEVEKILCEDWRGSISRPDVAMEARCCWSGTIATRKH